MPERREKLYRRQIEYQFSGELRAFGPANNPGVVVLYAAENDEPSLSSIQWKSQLSALRLRLLLQRNIWAEKFVSCNDLGCGAQGSAQLRALCLVLPLRNAYAFDVDSMYRCVLLQNFRANLRST